MASESAPPTPSARIFAMNGLTLGVVPPGLDADQADWLRLRQARPALDTPVVRGAGGAAALSRTA
jgi:hypothetical protein